MKQLLKKIIIAVLTLEARIVLKKYKPQIIAVTGNVGKTSAKDSIYEVLNESFFVRKSKKSYNSELGIPLTILGCETGWNNVFIWLRNIFEGFALIFLKNHYPKWLVLEVGADRPGDIEKITKWLKPNIVVITRFGSVPVHVEFFGSPEKLIEEKSYLVSALKKNGLLVLNNDDDKALSFRKKWGGMIMTYGFEKGSAIIASHYKIMYENKKLTGITFKVDYDGSSVPVKLFGVLGKQHVYSALVALSVGAHLKLNMVSMIQALEAQDTPPGRMKILLGIKDSYIIDDSYNASPVATEAALDVLKEVKTEGKKIAILGDMLELGRYTTAEHKKVGEIVGGICDLFLVVGLRAKGMVQGALLGGMSEKDISEFDDSQKAGKYLEKILSSGDIVLVKGSQGMRMERAVGEIMAHPQRKAELLVRQEPEWLER